MPMFSSLLNDKALIVFQTQPYSIKDKNPNEPTFFSRRRIYSVLMRLQSSSSLVLIDDEYSCDPRNLNATCDTQAARKK